MAELFSFWREWDSEMTLLREGDLRCWFRIRDRSESEDAFGRDLLRLFDAMAGGERWTLLQLLCNFTKRHKKLYQKRGIVVEIEKQIVLRFLLFVFILEVCYCLHKIVS